MEKDNQEIPGPITTIAEQFWPNKKPWPIGVSVTAVDESDPIKGNKPAICTKGTKIFIKSGDWVLRNEEGFVSLVRQVTR